MIARMDPQTPAPGMWVARAPAGEVMVVRMSQVELRVGGDDRGWRGLVGVYLRDRVGWEERSSLVDQMISDHNAKSEPVAEWMQRVDLVRCQLTLVGENPDRAFPVVFYCTDLFPTRRELTRVIEAACERCGS